MRNRAFLILWMVCVLTSRRAFAAEPLHDFSKWEPEITAYERQDATNPPPKGAVLFIGSSTIRLWSTLAQDFPNQQVINRGFGGSEIVDATHFADRIVFPYEPSRIFFRSGGNDLWNGKSPEQVFDDFREFVKMVQARLPKTEIVFISWSPTPSRWKQAEKEKQLNELTKRLARWNKLVGYIETYDMPLGADGKPRSELFRQDQLHFNKEGYKLLAERVRSYLEK